MLFFFVVNNLKISLFLAELVGSRIDILMGKAVPMISAPMTQQSVM
jgi:hypothetical protein